MSPVSELQRVLAALDDLVLNDQGDMTAKTAEDAARVIREMSAEVERLKQERDEAIAARETYAMTARQDVIEKAQALDELEAWLRENYDSYAEIEVDSPGALVRLLADGPNAERFGRAQNLAAAIRAALEKARAE